MFLFGIFALKNALRVLAATHSLLLTCFQAVEAAQLAEDLKVQLEHTQAKLREIQASVSDNRTARERESFNLKKAQVHTRIQMHTLLTLSRLVLILFCLRNGPRNPPRFICIHELPLHL